MSNVIPFERDPHDGPDHRDDPRDELANLPELPATADERGDEPSGSDAAPSSALVPRQVAGELVEPEVTVHARVLERRGAELAPVLPGWARSWHGLRSMARWHAR